MGSCPNLLYYHIITLNDFTNVISKPTRVSETFATLLDPILISNTVHTLHSDTLDVESSISDHKATLVIINFCNTQRPCSKRKIWYYVRVDFNQLNLLIDNENWDFIDNLNLDEAINRFSCILMNFMNQCIPSKEIITRPNDKPWYDSQIRRKSRQRDRLKSFVTKSELLTDCNKYKKMRDKVNNLNKYAKQRYYNNLDE